MMFETFAASARQAIATAMTEARGSGSNRIACENLLLALAQARSGPAVEALTTAGLDLGRLRELRAKATRSGRASGQPVATDADRDPLDAESLATIGIDLDAVRQAAEAAFGPGALDRKATSRRAGRAGLTPDAKKAVELALRSAQAGHHRSISAGDLLIGIIDQGDNAAITMLSNAQLRPADLRADVVRRMAAAR